MDSNSYSNETKLRKWGLFPYRLPPNKMNNRLIISNVRDMDVPDNSIKTSKYTSIITFIPLNLIEQFSNLVNVYFLIIAIMQMITEISITNDIGPLLILICISMIKDFVEDYKIQQQDNVENNKTTYLIRTNEAPRIAQWSELRIGDLIKIQNDEQIPADILLIQTSDKQGNAFIETKNLDGETNLKCIKIKRNLNQLQEQTESDLLSLRMIIKYERPNPYYYLFNGSVEINNQQIPLSQENLILRGSVLRNVKFIYGIVCYNGHDTKIMLNSVKPQSKHSHLERTLGRLIIFIFQLQIIMCGLGAFLNSLWQLLYNSQLSYLEILDTDLEHNFIKNLLIKWGSWILIFSNLIPILLLVSLHIVKYFQGILITMDQETYSSENNIKTSVQQSNLNEELGQVDYIFCDKTGTLTKNQMYFKCLTVNNKSYGKKSTLTNEEVSKLAQVSNVDFRDKDFFNDLNQTPGMGPLHDFLLCLSICHSVITENNNGQLLYQAQSSDELALVNFARYCGYTFQGLDELNRIVINIRGEIQYYQLLQVFEFNSTRKRFSIIVKDQQNQIILYTKGPDSIIQHLMKPIQNELKEKTWKDLQEFALIGLRTLLLTKRVLSLELYNEWEIGYREAFCQKKDDLMMDHQVKLEKELEYIGGTAIEDKLQEDVGPTIQSLKDAGIKIWVLTGDKIETAINIGYSCQLLNDSLQQIIIDGNNEQSVTNELEQSIQKIQKNNKNSLVISGYALQLAMKPELSLKIMEIAEKCEAVIACRVTPKQKQDIVQLVRKNKPNVITLAIGDGANDVNMITAAHIGIGIIGNEGLQAAKASDYAIGEFKILKRLILYHGRENYRKNSTLINYNFYKTILLVLPQYWWAVNNGFSAIMFYDQLLYQSYNLFFTSLPIVLYAILDEEFTGDILTSNPSLYDIGIKHKLFNLKTLLYWVFTGTIQAAILTYLTFQIYETSSISNGMMSDLWITGSIVLGFSVLNSNIKIILFSNTYSMGIIAGLYGSIIIYIILFTIVSEKMNQSEISSNLKVTYNNLRFYLTSLLIIGTTSIFDFAFTKLTKQIQQAHVEIQPFRVSSVIKSEHVELQDEQLLNQPYTKIYQTNSLIPKSHIKQEFVNFAFSEEKH